ncbi:MAG: DUF4058 family protein [Planctomycetia bacterium]|nr:DUF4058 family protein [Planctomycetia bacterium]
MPSPFPGMDPYLEDPAFWPGFHARLIVSISSHLNRVLPKGLYVDIEEHLWLRDEDETDEHPLLVGRADVTVNESRRTGSASSKHRSGLTLKVPTANVTVTQLPPRKMRYLKVVDSAKDRVITAIELLSPANKNRSQHYDAYVAKREEYLAGNTSLVEIDLLRAGVRPPMFTDTPPVDDYYLFVCAADRFPRASIWAFGVRDRIPNLEVPLRPREPSAVLDLNGMVHATYDENRYSERIEYSKQPKPPFRGGAKEWVDRRLTRHRKEHP